jgi:hypothetical protein
MRRANSVDAAINYFRHSFCTGQSLFAMAYNQYCAANSQLALTPTAHLTHNTSPAAVSCKTLLRHTPRAIPDYPTITAVLRTFSQVRMKYLEQSGTVNFRSKDGHTTKSFSALDWLALIISHIPRHGEQMVRYYGYL